MDASERIETITGRGRRNIQNAGPIPRILPLLDVEQTALLRRWASRDEARRGRATLMKDAGAGGIERAEGLCQHLLDEGWITRSERLRGGVWQWEAFTWRDLRSLQILLGVSGPRQRAEDRETLWRQAQEWLQDWRAATEQPDPDLLDALEQALAQLRSERALPLSRLANRLGLLRSLASWQDTSRSGTRRDFALHAGDATKALSPADWQWLESGFDLERLRIARFAPMIWMAGEMTLEWNSGHTLQLGALHCSGMPVEDVCRTAAISSPHRWWLIENRASFERQARSLPPHVGLIWMPGHPPAAWMRAMAHLLSQAPAPAWISADADPAGVDIACSVGALWNSAGLVWEPHRMGLAQWAATQQYWPLNDHDRRLLQRLLTRPELPTGLRALCNAMNAEGRKAEQEGWL